MTAADVYALMIGAVMLPLVVVWALLGIGFRRAWDRAEGGRS